MYGASLYVAGCDNNGYILHDDYNAHFSHTVRPERMKENVESVAF